MESKPDQTPLIVIVGETASGKTALALDLAEKFRGEIIAADSRTIYRGMDIGTAKPTLTERSRVPHHLIDILSPDQVFTAAEFKRLANEAIHQISLRQHLPFIVGGTGLYIDAVIYDFEFRGDANPELREELRKMTVEELQGLLSKQGVPLPNNDRNPRHLIRAIETRGAPAMRTPLRENTLVIGIKLDREVLRSRVTSRVEAMMSHGYVKELEQLAERYSWDAPGLQSPGHKAFRKYLAKELTLEEATNALINEHMQLAKRQRTWFRRNKSIHWICKKEEAVDLVTTFLNKVYTA